MLAHYSGSSTVRSGRLQNQKTRANIRGLEAMLLCHESPDFVKGLVLLLVEADYGRLVLLPFLRHGNCSTKLSAKEGVLW